VSSKGKPVRALLYAFAAVLYLGCPGSIFLGGGVISAQDINFNTTINSGEYIVGPGDQFRIDFWDGSTEVIDVNVTPEGSVLLTSMGMVNIGGLNLLEAKKKLRQLISGFYADIDFTVSLVGVRPIKVLVSGGVAKPGLYDGFVSQRVSEFIERAGGLLPGASRRNITLSDGAMQRPVDLLKFERAGDFEANPYMYSGYRIQVPLVTDSSSFVQISGEVVRPGEYEYRESDNLASMIGLAMGFTGLQGDSVDVFRQSEPDHEKMVVAIGNLDLAVKPADKIIVRKAARNWRPDYYSLSGMVVMPGRYPYSPGMTLQSVLDRAGGLTERGDIYSLSLYRRPEFMRSQKTLDMLTAANQNNISFSGEREPMSLEISGDWPDRLDEIEISPGDSVVVPVRSGVIGIYGLVNRPGVIEIESHKPRPADYFIDRAGGYARWADRSYVRVIRKSSGLTISATPDIYIHDGDTIIIPELKQKKNFWEKARDVAITLGGLGLIYLAVDNAVD